MNDVGEDASPAAALPSCPNCGTPAPDRFCPHCGQRTGGRLVSFRSLVRDVLEDQLSLEARLPRTLGALLGRPGKLTADYAEGRVARYIPPFRLYLLAGLLFFFVVSFVASFDAVWRSSEEFFGELTPERLEESDFSVVNIPLDPQAFPAPLRPLARRYVRKEAELNAMPPREALRILTGEMVGNVSAVLFLLVPAFALLLKALYPRSLYIEHFVFILHLHAAAFLFALLPLLARYRWTAVAVLVVLVLYLFLALRRVYRQRWSVTLAKLAVLVPTYLLAFIAVTMGVIVVTVLTF